VVQDILDLTSIHQHAPRKIRTHDATQKYQAPNS